jgi:hypothetical protein
VASVASGFSRKVIDLPRRQRDNGDTRGLSYELYMEVLPMNAKVAAVLIVAGLLLPARPIAAHHAFAAEFDANKPIKLTGAVTKVDWRNPHTWFFIDVKDDAGKVTNWGLEMGSPNGLMRLGWTRNSMKIGDVVTVEGSRARDGSTIANAQAVVLTSTGQKLFAGSSQNQQP